MALCCIVRSKIFVIEEKNFELRPFFDQNFGKILASSNFGHTVGNNLCMAKLLLRTISTNIRII